VEQEEEEEGGDDDDVECVFDLVEEDETTMIK